MNIFFLVSFSTLINKGIIKTSGITIEALDGSFKYESNKVFKPNDFGSTNPFSDNCVLRGSSNSFKGGVANNIKTGLSNGAKKVRVFHPYSTKPLYGALLFCKKSSVAASSGPDEYSLFVPKSYIDNAIAGRVSAVYELFTNSGNGQIAWILWLSKEPI
ncbi:MAG: hypothetical protein ABW124_20385 [Candidatus Thiodiazotropha sp. 6PLUC9]